MQKIASFGGGLLYMLRDEKKTVLPFILFHGYNWTRLTIYIYIYCALNCSRYLDKQLLKVKQLQPQVLLYACSLSSDK